MAAIATPWGSISTRARAAFYSIAPLRRPAPFTTDPFPFHSHPDSTRFIADTEVSTKKKNVRNIKGCAAWRQSAAEVHLDRDPQIHSAQEKNTSDPSMTLTWPIEPIEKYRIRIWLFQ